MTASPKNTKQNIPQTEPEFIQEDRNEINFADSIQQNFGFILFVFFLGIVYIYNMHYTAKAYKEVQVLQQQTKELRWEYTGKQVEAEKLSRPSTIAKILSNRNINIKAPSETPKRITAE